MAPEATPSPPGHPESHLTQVLGRSPQQEQRGPGQQAALECFSLGLLSSDPLSSSRVSYGRRALPALPCLPALLRKQVSLRDNVHAVLTVINRLSCGAECRQHCISPLWCCFLSTIRGVSVGVWEDQCSRGPGAHHVQEHDPSKDLSRHPSVIPAKVHKQHQFPFSRRTAEA